MYSFSRSRLACEGHLWLVETSVSPRLKRSSWSRDFSRGGLASGIVDTKQVSTLRHWVYWALQ